MAKITVNRSIESGFEKIQVLTGPLELTMIPELGGKISNLRDSRSGREWLWRHPRMAYSRVNHGHSYVDLADTGGWDECFPSVSACEYPVKPWQGAAIQDHGELWSQVPELLIDQRPTEISLQTIWKGVVLPYTFTRVIKLEAGSARLRVEYAVESNHDEPFNFIWCIHPLLAIEQGMQLHIPASASFNSNGTIPENLLEVESGLRFPFEMQGLNLPSVPEPSAARSIKIWSSPLGKGDGWAALSTSDGKLSMQWDVKLLPQLAVWMNFGAWAGDGGTPYFNLGIEPCIGAQDSLADAILRNKIFAKLLPHETKNWWLEMEFTI